MPLIVKKSPLGNESPQHYKAKERLVQVLQDAGYENIKTEAKQPKTMLEFLGERRFITDLEATKEGRIFIFEVDGKKGHSSKRAVAKGNSRDGALYNLRKWPIHLRTWDLIGKRKLSDREILEEIEYQSER
jgi:hypothetical protein